MQVSNVAKELSIHYNSLYRWINEINRKRVASLMRELKLWPKGTRYRYKNYNKKLKVIEGPNLLNQMFQTDSKNKIWVGDITYIPTKKGTLYLALFLDIYSRKVVGWSYEVFL